MLYLKMTTIYYRVNMENEYHNNIQYKEGLNILKDTFNNDIYDNGAGGFYFTTKNNIKYFLCFGIYIRKIIIPYNEPDFQMLNILNIDDTPTMEYRANKIIIDEKYFIYDYSTIYKFNLYEYLRTNGYNINILNYVKNKNIIHKAITNLYNIFGNNLVKYIILKGYVKLLDILSQYIIIKYTSNIIRQSFFDGNIDILIWFNKHNLRYIDFSKIFYCITDSIVFDNSIYYVTKQNIDVLLLNGRYIHKIYIQIKDNEKFYCIDNINFKMYYSTNIMNGDVYDIFDPNTIIYFKLYKYMNKYIDIILNYKTTLVDIEKSLKYDQCCVFKEKLNVVNKRIDIGYNSHSLNNLKKEALHTIIDISYTLNIFEYNPNIIEYAILNNDIKILQWYLDFNSIFKYSNYAIQYAFETNYDDLIYFLVKNNEFNKQCSNCIFAISLF